MSIVRRIEDGKIVIVYRGWTAEECLWASEALLEGGISLFEVTMNSPDPAGSIGRLRAAFGEDAGIGAGTVTRAEQLEMAAEAGAAYIVSPNTRPTLIRRTRELGLASIPGALTPSEVIEARDAGADMVKIFPIKTVGPDYLRQLTGPIDDVPFVATGGVNLEMIPALFDAGTAAVALGLHLMGVDPRAKRDRALLRDQAIRFVEAAGARAA